MSLVEINKILFKLVDCSSYMRRMGVLLYVVDFWDDIVKVN